MKRSILSLALLSCLALAAHATPGGEHNNTGCNGKGNANSPCTGNGGAGGHGGAGGTAVSASRAEARAMAAAIAAQRQAQALNSTITNTVNAAPIKVRVNVTAPAAAAEAKTPALETVKEAPVAEKLAAAPELVRQDRPVSTAYAPNINPTSPCALTVSGGIQARELGLSFGGTPIADFCEKLEIARSAFNEGEADVAKEVKCGIPAYRAARLRLKKPCAEDLQAGAERAAAILEDRHTRAYIAAKDPALLP